MSSPLEGGYFGSAGLEEQRNCALCERRPARMYCVQDDAALCAECDLEVHSQPEGFLFGRHERVPIGIAPVPEDFKSPLVSL